MPLLKGLVGLSVSVSYDPSYKHTQAQIGSEKNGGNGVEGCAAGEWERLLNIGVKPHPEVMLWKQRGP